MQIFLVDDDADDRALFEEAFENVRALSTDLTIFEDGVSLLEYLRQPENDLPHIIFLDLNMPMKSGVDCLREIRQDKRLRDVSVAIYSTSNSARDIEDTFSGGANVYIHKPSSFDQLKKTLSHVLKLNWQFHLSGMNKETFFLNV
ncbi:response regulator [Flavobacterium sp. MAH-1]|uniref:Response regulator n=2 Tax=Flavobacterium agri TaxID=2743471 RepID=A0A7Y9C880_9FLAO|nr:response regulator [Flavobacterium agri]NYA72198.1 response regulator [Flavobacterium agri]